MLGPLKIHAMAYTDQTLMPFGMYKGKPLAAIPASYFMHLREQGYTNDENLNKYILENLDCFMQEIKRAKLKY